MSTEQLMAPSGWLPVARNVMRAASGSPAYRPLIGCWISLSAIVRCSASVASWGAIVP